MTNNKNILYYHPLDPLHEEEIKQAVSIIEKARENDKVVYMFNSISLKEPLKEKVLSYQKDPTLITDIEREALVVLIDRPSGLVHELTVSLTTQSILIWKKLNDVQPTLHVMEMLEAEKVLLTNELVIAECAKLGITDMSLVFADCWVVGFHKEITDRRLIQALMYTRTSKDDNQYAHPLDFFPIYDVNSQKVLEINYGVPKNSKYKRPTIPMENHHFLPEHLGESNLRKDLKPIHITQPEGVSFKIKNGREIEWQKWKFHIGFNYREGIIINHVTYQDGDQLRPLIYRLSLSEMVVPYANPYKPYYRKMAFDVGEFGLGNLTNSLTLGCDCVGSIHYLDATLCDMHGNPWTVPNAICIHEEDAGLLFKHTDFRTGKAHSARSRRLVVSQIITAANYDYGLYFYFYLDGTMQYEVKATGELNTHVLAKDEDPKPFGTIVAPQVVGQHHQHLFSMRIDPMIDGIENSFAQVDFEASELPTGHPDNEFGNAFYPVTTIFKNTDEAKTVADASKGRSWKIMNENKLHPFTNEPVGYKLVSTTTPLFLPKPDSIAAQRAEFATKTIWVTPYEDQAIYPAGFYCNQSTKPMGLPVWTKLNQPIQNKDIVVYLTFGLTHHVRVEDFPIMPVETCGFTLKPSGFFNGNPAIDVPSSINSCSVKAPIQDPDYRTNEKNVCCQK
ncbi:copper amine oxidase [Cunninghamella echinulata]|nr:copper amine oxidase [Cunninghamella echinulata]